MQRLADQIKGVLAAFDDFDKSPTLIGGLAFAAHSVVCTTRDVDALSIPTTRTVSILFCSR